jgi:hypothetical protein
MSEPVSSHSIKLNWAGNAFYATSIRRSASSATEVDITNIDSTITSDPNNSGRKMIWKEVESCVADPGEVSVEFFANENDMRTLVGRIGHKSTLTASMDGTAVFFKHSCILSKVDFDASVGEYVKGSIVFRLSGSQLP